MESGADASTETAITRREVRERLHEAMVRIRAFEDAVAEGHRDGHLGGLLHLSHGAEAVAVGVLSSLSEDDRVYSSHRPHGHFLAAGADPHALMAELGGRDSGLCRGRGGSMHLASERAVMATGIVGATLPLAVGHALALAPGDIVAVFFGDGAVQTGYFHESLNLASLWRAPVLFVCENNGLAEFSAREEHTRVAAVSRYGDLFGIEARTIAGIDVELVAASAQELIQGVRAGSGPALLECHIERLRSHYEGDPAAATASQEMSPARDPIAHSEAALVALDADPDELAQQREYWLAAARGLLVEALSDPAPDPALDAELVFERRLR